MTKRTSIDEMLVSLEQKVRVYLTEEEKVEPSVEGKGLHPILTKDGPQKFDIKFGTREGDKVFTGDKTYEYDEAGNDLIRRETKGGKKLTAKEYIKKRNAEPDAAVGDEQELEKQPIEAVGEYADMIKAATSNGMELKSAGTAIQPVNEYAIDGKDVKLQIAVNDDYKFTGNKNWLLVGKFGGKTQEKSGSTVAELSSTLKSLIPKVDDLEAPGSEEAEEPKVEESVIIEAPLPREVPTFTLDAVGGMSLGVSSQQWTLLRAGKMVASGNTLQHLQQALQKNRLTSLKSGNIEVKVNPDGSWNLFKTGQPGQAGRDMKTLAVAISKTGAHKLTESDKPVLNKGGKPIPKDEPVLGKRVTLLEVLESTGLKYEKDIDECHVFSIPGQPLHEIYVPKKKSKGGYKFTHMYSGDLASLPGYLKRIKGGKK